ncbi:MAG: hypothetical protein LBT12_01640 [Oscillospiraceae bacterium]|jgi:hypothetical protein|nr:hypothetical protein [Oscillospiraceae bacterium]
MKRKFIRAAAAMLSGILLLSGALAQTGAAANEAKFNGADAAEKWTVATVYDGENREEINDLFDLLTKNLVPGDDTQITVQLRNAGANAIVFYLKATALNADEANALADESLYGAGVTDDALNTELLSLIDIKVRHDGTEIYAGTLGGDSAPGLLGAGEYDDLYSDEYGVRLGQVSSGYAGSIAVDLHISEKLGDKFQNLLTGVKWEFIAEQVQTTAPGGGPTTTTSPKTEPTDDPADPPVVITDDETPLTDLDDTPITDIDDPEVPLADIIVVPKTGDEGGLLTYSVVAGVALVVMVALLIVSSSKRKKT